MYKWKRFHRLTQCCIGSSLLVKDASGIEQNDYILHPHASNMAKLHIPGLILGLCPANERRRYKVTPSLIDWVQT